MGVATTGETFPYTVDFPDGVQGHLQVQLEITSDDAWRLGTVESKVYSGEITSILGTIDSREWVEHAERFVFAGEDVLSTESREGIRRLNLNY